MTDGDVNKIRGVVKEEIGSALKPVTKKLDILWDQVEKVTENLEEVKETLELHTAFLKRIEPKVENNSDDIIKLDKRLTEIENREGIVPPPEFTIAG